MTDEYQLINEIERARQAQELIEHPLFVEAFETYRERLMKEWADSPARDTDGREKLWLMTKLLNGVENHLKELMQTGKLASLQLEQKRTLAQRLKLVAQGWQ